MYTKNHLYNLDSDDDELDFLHKDLNFEERAEVHKSTMRAKKPESTGPEEGNKYYS